MTVPPVPEGLQLSERHGVLVASVTGEIDLANGPELADAVVAGATAATRGMVVDLTAVTFLDSAGVRFLDQVTARGAGRQVLVVAPAGGGVAYTLRLCGFPADRVRDGLAAAVAELRDPGDLQDPGGGTRCP